MYAPNSNEFRVSEIIIIGFIGWHKYIKLDAILQDIMYIRSVPTIMDI